MLRRAFDHINHCRKGMLSVLSRWITTEPEFWEAAATFILEVLDQNHLAEVKRLLQAEIEPAEARWFVYLLFCYLNCFPDHSPVEGCSPPTNWVLLLELLEQTPVSPRWFQMLEITKTWRRNPALVRTCWSQMAGEARLWVGFLAVFRTHVDASSVTELVGLMLQTPLQDEQLAELFEAAWEVASTAPLQEQIIQVRHLDLTPGLRTPLVCGHRPHCIPAPPWYLVVTFGRPPWQGIVDPLDCPAEPFRLRLEAVQRNSKHCRQVHLSFSHRSGELWRLLKIPSLLRDARKFRTVWQNPNIHADPALVSHLCSSTFYPLLDSNLDLTEKVETLAFYSSFELNVQSFCTEKLKENLDTNIGPVTALVCAFTERLSPTFFYSVYLIGAALLPHHSRKLLWSKRPLGLFPKGGREFDEIAAYISAKAVSAEIEALMVWFTKLYTAQTPTTFAVVEAVARVFAPLLASRCSKYPTSDWLLKVQGADVAHAAQIFRALLLSRRPETSTVLLTMFSKFCLVPLFWSTLALADAKHLERKPERETGDSLTKVYRTYLRPIVFGALPPPGSVSTSLTLVTRLLNMAFDFRPARQNLESFHELFPLFSSLVLCAPVENPVFLSLDRLLRKIRASGHNPFGYPETASTYHACFEYFAWLAIPQGLLHNVEAPALRTILEGSLAHCRTIWSDFGTNSQLPAEPTAGVKGTVGAFLGTLKVFLEELVAEVMLWEPPKPLTRAAPVSGQQLACCICHDLFAVEAMKVLVPCGHQCVCDDCLPNVHGNGPNSRNRCPLCRSEIVMLAPLFQNRPGDD